MIVMQLHEVRGVDATRDAPSFAVYIACADRRRLVTRSIVQGVELGNGDACAATGRANQPFV